MASLRVVLVRKFERRLANDKQVNRSGRCLSTKNIAGFPCLVQRHHVAVLNCLLFFCVVRDRDADYWPERQQSPSRNDLSPSREQEQSIEFHHRISRKAPLLWTERDVRPKGGKYSISARRAKVAPKHWPGIGGVFVSLVPRDSPRPVSPSCPKRPWRPRRSDSTRARWKPYPSKWRRKVAFVIASGAKRSTLQPAARLPGLLRRFAPRNNGVFAVTLWIHKNRPEADLTASMAGCDPAGGGRP